MIQIEGQTALYSEHDLVSLAKSILTVYAPLNVGEANIPRLARREVQRWKDEKATADKYP